MKFTKGCWQEILRYEGTCLFPRKIVELIIENNSQLGGIENGKKKNIY